MIPVRASGIVDVVLNGQTDLEPKVHLLLEIPAPQTMFGFGILVIHRIGTTQYC